MTRFLRKKDNYRNSRLIKRHFSVLQLLWSRSFLRSPFHHPLSLTWKHYHYQYSSQCQWSVDLKVSFESSKRFDYYLLIKFSFCKCVLKIVLRAQSSGIWLVLGLFKQLDIGKTRIPCNDIQSSASAKETISDFVKRNGSYQENMRGRRGTLRRWLCYWS